MPAEEYVLSRFEYERQNELAEIIDIACEALDVVVSRGRPEGNEHLQ